MRLLNVEKMMSAKSPGAALIARMLPRKSIAWAAALLAHRLVLRDAQEGEVHERERA